MQAEWQDLPGITRFWLEVARGMKWQGPGIRALQAEGSAFLKYFLSQRPC